MGIAGAVLGLWLAVVSAVRGGPVAHLDPQPAAGVDLGWRGVAAAAPLALAGLVGLASWASPWPPKSSPIRTSTSTARSRPWQRPSSGCPAGESIDYRFGALDLGTQPMEPGLRFLLVRHRDRVLAPGSFPRLGSYYVLAGHPYQWVVYITDGARRQPHMRLVSRVSFRSPWGREVLSAWVRRVQPPRRSS